MQRADAFFKHKHILLDHIGQGDMRIKHYNIINFKTFIMWLCQNYTSLFKRSFYCTNKKMQVKKKNKLQYQLPISEWRHMGSIPYGERC